MQSPPRLTAANAGAMWLRFASLALALALCARHADAADVHALSGGDFTVQAPSRYNLSLPGTDLPPELRTVFFAGRTLFRQSWVVAPSPQSKVAGLGPIYNRVACVSCHLDNGRGGPPTGPDDAMHSMLVQLSVPGTAPHGEPKPHPGYGAQFNEHGIPGVPGNGRAAIAWEEFSETLPDGETVPMRRLRLSFPELNYGPLGADTMTSARVAPQILGLGLLEAVPEETILATAEAEKRIGIKGRPNHVWDGVGGRTVVGRFGLKANAASLKEEITGSFTFDLGLTTPMFPNKNCTPVQTACRAAPIAGHPEMSQERLDAVLVYYLALGVPARRNLEDPSVRRGERLFSIAGCSSCHTPTLKTGSHSVLGQLAGQEIHPYTDLLIHDMGDALTDGRPDFEAGPRDWRTTPLWGVGLAGVLNEHANYLHDGRARTLTEAILWHGGDADNSRRAFIDLPKGDRDAVLAFLKSL